MGFTTFIWPYVWDVAHLIGALAIVVVMIRASNKPRRA